MLSLLHITASSISTVTVPLCYSLMHWVMINFMRLIRSISTSVVCFDSKMYGVCLHVCQPYLLIFFNISIAKAGGVGKGAFWGHS